MLNPVSTETGQAQGLCLSYAHVQCYSCHPSYVPGAEINRIRGLPEDTAYGEDLHLSKLKRDSAFEVEGYRVAIPAPDFTWHTMRSGRTAKDVYQTIAAGIGGAGMPTWKGAVAAVGTEERGVRQGEGRRMRTLEPMGAGKRGGMGGLCLSYAPRWHGLIFIIQLWRPAIGCSRERTWTTPARERRPEAIASLRAPIERED